MLEPTNRPYDREEERNHLDGRWMDLQFLHELQLGDVQVLQGSANHDGNHQVMVNHLEIGGHTHTQRGILGVTFLTNTYTLESYDKLNCPQCINRTEGVQDHDHFLVVHGEQTAVHHLHNRKAEELTAYPWFFHCWKI